MPFKRTVAECDGGAPELISDSIRRIRLEDKKYTLTIWKSMDGRIVIDARDNRGGDKLHQVLT